MSELRSRKPNGTAWTLDAILDWCAVPGNLTLVGEQDRLVLISDRDGKFKIDIWEYFLRVQGKTPHDVVSWGKADLTPEQYNKLLTIINQAKIDKVFGSGS